MERFEDIESWELDIVEKNESIRKRAENSLAIAEGILKQQSLSKDKKEDSCSVSQNVKDALAMLERANKDDVIWESSSLHSESEYEKQKYKNAEGSGCKESSENNDEIEVIESESAKMRLQKVKMSTLENKIKQLQEILREKEKDVIRVEKELKDTKAAAEQTNNINKRLEAQSEKTKKQYLEYKAKYEVLEQQLKDINHGIKTNDKERLKYEEEQRRRDTWLKSATEEIERQRKLAESLRHEAQETMKNSRVEYERVISESKKLEKQKSELVVAFRKQMKLIDVLKRQKIHLETSRAINFSEEEFLRILDVTKE